FLAGLRRLARLSSQEKEHAPLGVEDNIAGRVFSHRRLFLAGRPLGLRRGYPTDAWVHHTADDRVRFQNIRNITFHVCPSALSRTRDGWLWIELRPRSMSA